MLVDELAFSDNTHAAMSGAPVSVDVSADTDETERDRSQWGTPITVSVPPKSGKEYKFYLVEGGTMEYSWAADKGDLFFDFHGEPTGGKKGYSESFKKAILSKFDGTFTAPFSGTIGWYWKNNTSSTIVVTLKAKGSYIVMDGRSKPELDELISREKKRQMKARGTDLHSD